MLKPSFLLFIGFAFLPLFTMAENGLVTVNSQYTVEETAELGKMSSAMRALAEAAAN